MTYTIIKELQEKHPHLNKKEFATEVWARLHPNRYDFNKFLFMYREGKIPNEEEINEIRKIWIQES